MKRFDINNIEQMGESGIASNATPIEVGTYGVYFLTKGDRVVYVGKGKNPAIRVMSHCGDKSFDGFFIVNAPKSEIGRLEVFFIKKFRPIFNVEHNSSESVSIGERGLARKVYIKFGGSPEVCLSIAKLLFAVSASSRMDCMVNSTSIDELWIAAKRIVGIKERLIHAMSNTEIRKRIDAVGMTREWAGLVVPTMGTVLDAISDEFGMSKIGPERRKAILALCHMKELSDIGLLPFNTSGWELANFRKWANENGLVCPVMKFVYGN